MVLVHDPPAFAQLTRQRGQLAASQRRRAAFAGSAFFVCQIGHVRIYTIS
jgi:hypothetical protein